MLVALGFRLRSTKSTVFLLAAMTITATALTMGRAIQVGGDAALEQIAAKAKRADITFYGRRPTLEKLRSRTEFAATGPTRAVTSVELLAENGTTELVLAMDLPRFDAPVGRLTIVAGQRPLDLSVGVVVVEPSIAEVGDTIRVRREGLTTSLRVVGTAIELGGCGAPSCRPGRLFLPEATFRTVLGDPQAADGSLGVVLKPGVDPGVLGGQIRSSSQLGIFRVTTWTDVRRQLLAPDDLLGGFVSGLGVFLLVASIVVIAGTVRTQMMDRQRDLAVVNLLGAQPRLLGWAALAEQLLLAVVGSILGWISGSLLAPLAKATMARSIGWGGPSFQTRNLALVLIVIAVVVLFATAATAWRSARLPIVSLLRNDGVGGVPRARWSARIHDVVTGLGIRDPFTRPTRSLFSLLGLAVATAGCLTTAALGVTVRGVTSERAHPGEIWDVSLWSMTERTTESLRTEVAALPGIARSFTSRSDQARVDSVGFLAYAQKGEVEWATFIVHGRGPRTANEAVATPGFLQSTDTAIGDTMTFTVLGHQLKSTITGVFRDPTNGGRVLRYSLDLLRSVEPKVDAGILLVQAAPDTTRPELLAQVQRQLGLRAQSFAARSAKEEVRAVNSVLLVLGLLIALLGLVQLLMATLVGAREQRKEIALLHALGMTTSQLRRKSALGAITVAVGALVLAVPLSLATSWLIGTRAVARAGLDNGAIRLPSVGSFALAGAVVFLIAARGAARIVGGVSEEHLSSALRSD